MKEVKEPDQGQDVVVGVVHHLVYSWCWKDGKGSGGGREGSSAQHKSRGESAE